MKEEMKWRCREKETEKRGGKKGGKRKRMKER